MKPLSDRFLIALQCAWVCVIAAGVVVLFHTLPDVSELATQAEHRMENLP